uniref:Uncharacterized protein n=1 Tax=Bionectria ochroleuca TaxID=29856 RepID=A0A8H7N867_BIOOC
MNASLIPIVPKGLWLADPNHAFAGILPTVVRPPACRRSGVVIARPLGTDAFRPLALLFSLTPAGLFTVVLRLDVLWLTSQPHDDGDGEDPPQTVAGCSEFPILLHAASHT